MPKGDKYAPLTAFLVQSSQETVHMSFSDIDELCGFPTYAYHHSAAWSNASQHSLSYGWLLADYVVEDYSLSEKWVTFRHDSVKAKNYLIHSNNRRRKVLIVRSD